MRFSQRIGKSPIKTTLQVESIDKQLENRLWNLIIEQFFDKLVDYRVWDNYHSRKHEVCLLLWKEFFNERIDHYDSPEATIDFIRDWYFIKSDWASKYDFIEVLAKIGDELQLDFTQKCNEGLKKEISGYRIVNKRIVQITTEEEILSIEEALTSTEQFSSVNTHLKSALEKISDRQSPDYRNSIKESVSAVESFCKIITGDDKATLGKALAILEKKHSLHGSLKESFAKLYGYTSDAAGIRHSLLESDNPLDFSDAKFMLVSCSGFINYLKAKLEI